MDNVTVYYLDDRVEDDYIQYVVAHNLVEFINYYHNNIEEINSVYFFDHVVEADLENECLWSEKHVTEEDRVLIGDSGFVSRGYVGDLIEGLHDYRIYKNVLWKDYLKDCNESVPFSITTLNIY